MPPKKPAAAAKADARQQYTISSQENLVIFLKDQVAHLAIKAASAGPDGGLTAKMVVRDSAAAWRLLTGRPADASMSGKIGQRIYFEIVNFVTFASDPARAPSADEKFVKDLKTLVESALWENREDAHIFHKTLLSGGISDDEEDEAPAPVPAKKAAAVAAPPASAARGGAGVHRQASITVVEDREQLATAEAALERLNDGKEAAESVLAAYPKKKKDLDKQIAALRKKIDEENSARLAGKFAESGKVAAAAAKDAEARATFLSPGGGAHIANPAGETPFGWLEDNGGISVSSAGARSNGPVETDGKEIKTLFGTSVYLTMVTLGLIKIVSAPISGAKRARETVGAHGGAGASAAAAAAEEEEEEGATPAAAASAVAFDVAY